VRIFASRWVRWLVSLGLLTAVLWWADWHSVVGVLREVDAAWVAVAAVLALIDRIVLTYRWDLLLVVRGLCLRFSRLFRLQMAANFLGSFMPSSLGVDAIRIAALVRAGHSATEVVATTLVDRASMVLATFAFGSIMIVLLAGTRLPGDVAWLVLATTSVAALACLAFFHPRVRTWIAAALLPKLPAGVRDRVAEVGRATLAYRHEPRLLLWVSVVTVLLFVIRLGFAKAVTMACGVDVAFLDLALVIPILWIVVMIPITVGGIGLQEAGYVTLMGLLGISPAVAVSMSVIEHVVSRAVSLPGAFFMSDVVGARARAT